MVKAVEEFRYFNVLFSIMGTVIISLIGWAALNISHIPLIEQRIDNFMLTVNTELRDHEERLRKQEEKLNRVTYKI